MTTLAARGSGTPTTTGTTWATVTNAVDGAAGTNPATYATYTNATASAVATMEITGYGFSSSIAAVDTLNSVTVSLRHFENNTGRFASVRFQAFDGATAIGTAFTCTLATAARNDSTTFPVTLAQIRSSTFKVVVTITGAASTQSRVESIDYADVTADYTIAPPTITQAAYRFYADGTETASTALASQDTAPTVDTSAGDVNMQVRARLQSTNAVAVAATDDFQLQWEKNTSGTWVDIGGPESLTEEYPDINASTGQNIGAPTLETAVAQSFLGNGKRLSRAGFYLTRSVNVPVGDLTATLYAHAGTFGTSSIPTGAALAVSSTVAASTVPETPNTWFYFDFDKTFTLVNGTPYCIAISVPTQAASTYVRVAVDNTSGTHPGTSAGFISSWITSGTGSRDLIFRVYTASSVTPPTTVFYHASANLTDGAATTNRLGAGSGSFVAGKVSEDGLVDDLGWSANNYTELLYSVTLIQADLAPTDTLKFRVLRNGATTGLTYTQYPSVTIATGGPVDRTGTATGSITLAGTATGSKTVTATATGALTVAGSASGSAAAAPVLGQATGTITVSGVAAGVHGVAGTATGLLSLAGVASGQKTVGAVVSGSVTVAGAATGQKTVTATATGALTVSGVAAGAVSGAVTGQATGALVLAGTAAGIKTVTATATGQLAVAGAATGVRRATGIATGALSVTGVASGQKTVTATATGSLTLAGTSSGQKTVRATATGAITINSVALGLVEGNAVGRAIGALTVTGTATGVRGRPGQATGTLTVAGLAVGRRATTATATGSFTVAGHVVAVRATIATATGTLTITATARGIIPIAFDISGQWNLEAVDALQWGDLTVVDWYMTPT